MAHVTQMLQPDMCHEHRQPRQEAQRHAAVASHGGRLGLLTSSQVLALVFPIEGVTKCSQVQFQNVGLHI